jgi:hypothetical protein
MQIAHELVHGLAFCGAARNGRHLRPEATFFRFMHDGFDFHVSEDTPKRVDFKLPGAGKK